MDDATPASLGQLKIDRQAPTSKIKRRRKTRPLVLGGALALGLAALVLMPSKPEVQTSTVLQSYPSQQYLQLTASGYVVAQRRAAVASKGSGRLVELHVREGSLLKKGDLIARLDASDVQAAIGTAMAGVRQAEAGVRQAQAQARLADVELGNAEAEAQRSKSLQAQGFVSAQAFDANQRRLDAARAAQVAAMASVAQAQASLGQAQALLNVQNVNREQTEIRAPFDGVVLNKNANVGDMITPFSNASGSQGAVVTMADLSTLEVEADVSEGSLAKATKGQPVEITLDALPERRFTGQVAGIVPTVDRAKATVMTKIRFDQLDPRILPEMSAKVGFLSKAPTPAEQQPVLAVNPKTLLEKDGKQWLLRIKRDGDKELLEAVEVKAGRKLGDVVEVTGPLKSGERIVLAPSAKLKDGGQVTLATK
ncbi:efflux RND transporter periplasmic adaptor subunit [Roseateles oligotrophus]|uniref:Efflux RND transporter periplasmic adaptor subunit n=1 Tax=Roseateles oligotrophus TaxID=1769250 RepID=A0ABT2YKQ6_9BURK|nr:efflux RND transporter periplasmic adaptor subunit [Roseateles oligotrophus]MCV2370546.1 efflux RND transporter periplasmic adaptor subunit [Roseateles oligotrophus]